MKQSIKPIFSVAVCGIVEPLFSAELLPLVLNHATSNKCNAQLKQFTWPNELMEAARQSRFDLFILFLNPGIYSRKDSPELPHQREADGAKGDEVNAYELIAGMKSAFDKPVFVISNATNYGSRTKLEEAGADAVFWMPFSFDEFRAAFRQCPSLAPFRFPS